MRGFHYECRWCRIKYDSIGHHKQCHRCGKYIATWCQVCYTFVAYRTRHARTNAHLKNRARALEPPQSLLPRLMYYDTPELQPDYFQASAQNECPEQLSAILASTTVPWADTYLELDPTTQAWMNRILDPLPARNPTIATSEPSTCEPPIKHPAIPAAAASSPGLSCSH